MDFLIFCSRLHHYLFSIMSLVWVIIGRMIAGLGFTDGCGPVQREAGYGRHGGGLCDEADVGVILMPLHPLCSDEFGHFFLRKETDR